MNQGTLNHAGPTRQEPSMAFTTSFSRRYACDRCRGHKLRCNRDLTASLESPCQRCRKAGAICTIGSGSSWRTPGQSKRRALPKDGPPADLVITLCMYLPRHCSMAVAVTWTNISRQHQQVNDLELRSEHKSQHKAQSDVTTKPLLATQSGTTCFKTMRLAVSPWIQLHGKRSSARSHRFPTGMEK